MIKQQLWRLVCEHHIAEIILPVAGVDVCGCVGQLVRDWDVTVRKDKIVHWLRLQDGTRIAYLRLVLAGEDEVFRLMETAAFLRAGTGDGKGVMRMQRTV